MANDATTQAIDTAIVTLAAQPKSATVDGVNVTQQSLADLIAAHKYFAGVAATKSRNMGVRFSKIVPQGASGAGTNLSTFNRNV